MSGRRNWVRRFVGFLGPIPMALLAALGVVGFSLCAWAFNWGTNDPGDFWRRRQAQIDPLALWSMEVTPQPAGWPPARICMDSALKAAFTRPMPYIGEQPCRRVGDPVIDANRYAFRCELDGRMQGVSATYVGDMARDFTVTYTVTDLQGFVAHPGAAGSEYQQVRRYRRLGACPSGWNVGDQSGRNTAGGLNKAHFPAG